MKKSVQSVARCLAILRELNRSNGATLRVLSDNVSLPRGTVYRLLDTLISESYVNKDPHTGGYWLQPQVRDLGMGYDDQEWILSGATAAAINELYDELHWCLLLSTPEQDSMIIRLATERRHPESPRTIAGKRVPMLKYGFGYPYLAYCEPAARDDALDLIFADRPARLNGGENRVLTRDIVLGELDHVRTAGYSVHWADQRTRQLGVPVFHSGVASGSLTMTYFASAIGGSEIASVYAPRLRRVAELIALN